jgi:adenosine deaminase
VIDPKYPLCELHRHLDGSIRVETVVDLAREHGIALPADDVAGMRPFVHVDENEPGLMAFIARFRYLTEVLVDYEACHRVARENVQDAAAEGIDYIELRFSPWFMAERHGLDPAEVVRACVDGAREGERETGVVTGLIGILSRTYGPETCQLELDALLASRDELVAVDLAGDEKGFPAPLFREHFRQVRDAGLHVTIHAGEADGPHSVWSAIRDLGAERIGHGFRAVEDPALVDHLVTSGIGLESCPTSNLHISAVDSYAHHPIGALAAAGVRFCLNTDDPGISNITLEHEYAVAGPATGLGPELLLASQRNALDMAFLDATGKAKLRFRAAERAAGG